MAVTISWSSSAGGSSVSTVDHGSSANGNTTSAQQIFLRHDGDNPITACGFYFAQKSGTYSGSLTAADDFTELLEWGDGSISDDFGGVQINMDAENTFSGGATWGMSESQKTSADGYKFTMRTGVGDSISNPFTLSEKMSASMSTDGEIPADVNDCSFQLRLKVPVSEDTAGTRQFDQILKYTYSS